MEAVHDAKRLKELQALPLERKILITQTRLIEYFKYCDENGYEPVISVSGKDSTVLLHIARQIRPNIRAVFSDTGLEFEAVRKLAIKNGATVVRPKMQFTEVLTKYGYPLVSKEVSEAIYYARRIKNGKTPPPEKEQSYQVRDRAEADRADGPEDVTTTGGGTRSEETPKRRIPETIRRRRDLHGKHQRCEEPQNDFNGKMGGGRQTMIRRRLELGGGL